MARRTRFLLRLRPAILGWIVGLILMTVLTIAAVAYMETERAVKVLVDQQLEAVVTSTQAQLHSVLTPATIIVPELERMMHFGALPMDDPKALGMVFVEHMRPHKGLGWLGWAQLSDHSYTGGVRRPGEALRWNHSVLGAPTEEALVPPDGRFERVAPFDERPYDPIAKDWYQAATPDLTWSAPYRFSDGSWGISLTKSVLRDGEVIGVLLADYFMDDLIRMLDRVKVGHTGKVMLRMGTHGTLGSVHIDVAAALDDGLERRVDVGGVAHRLVVAPFRLPGGLDWDLAIVVPEEELTGVVVANAWRALGLGLLALLGAVVGAVWFSRAISQPISAISDELARISTLRFTDDPPPPTVIREIAVMGEALQGMKAALRSFSRYAPVDLVRVLVADGREAKLGGETREMTVVFSDIAGFTTLVESTTPDVVVDALGGYLDRMNVVIEHTQGSVCQYLGDGILAFWGAPRRLEDHALMGCRGALAMQAVAADLVARSAQEDRPPLPTRIGVNSGEVLVGNIGAPQRFNYAAVGDPVNTAARLEGLNKQYGTDLLIGQRTAELAGAAMVTRPIDLVRVKGKLQPVLVFELIADAELATEAQRALARDHGAAFAAYRRRAFAEAAEAFEAIGDAPATVLAERCRVMEASPPPEGWDGAREG